MHSTDASIKDWNRLLIGDVIPVAVRSINVQARNNTLELTAEPTLEVASNITDTIPHDDSPSLHDSSAGPSNRRHRSPSPQPQRSVRRRITSPAASIPSSPAHGLLDDPSHYISKTRLPAMTTTHKNLQSMMILFMKMSLILRNRVRLISW